MPTVTAYLLSPELFVGRTVRVDIECNSPLTLGASVVDWWGVSGKAPNALVLRSDRRGGLLPVDLRTAATTLNYGAGCRADGWGRERKEFGALTNFCSMDTGSVAVTTARSLLCSMSVELSRSRISGLVIAEGRLFSAARPMATMVHSERRRRR